MCLLHFIALNWVEENKSGQEMYLLVRQGGRKMVFAIWILYSDFYCGHQILRHILCHCTTLTILSIILGLQSSQPLSLMNPKIWNILQTNSLPPDFHFPGRALIIWQKADSSHLHDSNVKKSGSRSTGASKKENKKYQTNKQKYPKPKTLKPTTHKE